MSKPVAFHDLPADAFPFKIELIDIDSGEIAWFITVAQAGALEIPSMWPRVCKARVSFADGTKVEQEPAALCPECSTVVDDVEQIRADQCPACGATLHP